MRRFTTCLLLLSTLLFSNEIEKVKPVSNPNVKYNNSLNKYSLFDTSKKGMEELLKNHNISPEILSSIYNRVDNEQSIILTAIGYDYGYQRPDLADAFYKLVSEKDLSTDSKVRYADFLLRTNRVEEIPSVLKKMECLKNFKKSSECYYYLGLHKFLTTGKNKNMFLSMAASKVEKAKEIYNMKK